MGKKEVEYRECGERLTKFAKELYGTISELAKQLGVKNENNFSNWTKGYILPSGKTLKKLAELGLDVNWYLTGKGHDPSELTDIIDTNVKNKLKSLYEND